MAGSTDLRITPEELASRMADWNDSRSVLYRALARALEALIREGRLAPGTQLPAERSLAVRLRVSRGTVTAAYELLRDGGLVDTLHGSGTVVCRKASPVSGPREAHLATALPQDSLLRGDDSMSADHIDLRSASWVGADVVGSVNVSRLQRRLLEEANDGSHDRLGSVGLRSAVAAHLTQRGLPTEPSELLITTGAQQAISLAVQLYVGPGDAVVVEDPTYPGAVESLVAQQARILRVPLGRFGPELPTLRRAVDEFTPRLLYLVPSVHNPTGTVMPAPVRQRLCELLEGWNTVIIDDTTLAETQLDGAVPAPLATYADHDTASRVVTVGSLSKSLWDGLRMGWVRATPPTVERLARLKCIADLGTGQVTQMFAEDLLCSPETLFEERRHELRHRRQLVSSLLHELLPEWSWEQPAGGLCLWVDTGRPDVSSFCATAAEFGVSIIPPTVSSATSRFPGHLRLPYAQPPDVLRTGIQHLAAAWEVHASTPVAGIDQLDRLSVAG